MIEPANCRTHAMRWHAHHGTAGTGHLYQYRFKSFPVEEDEHLYSVLRYVQRNPVRAGLVERAEQWRWGSVGWRQHAAADEQKILAKRPFTDSVEWGQWVNQPQSESELAALRRCVQRGAPFGSHTWVSQTAARLGLGYTLCLG